MTSIPHGPQAETKSPWWGWPLLVVVSPLVAVALIVWLLAALLLQIVVWVAWCPRGRYALVVYSNSPIWHQYFEEQVLPGVGTRAAVLNWSERKQWKLSLAVILFRFFGGRREFNPMAVVFRPFGWLQRFRFYRAFGAFKHGRTHEVEELRREFLKTLPR